ncbi:MAG: aspartyl protease family protein [Steroidobacteraceae bacterium]
MNVRSVMFGLVSLCALALPCVAGAAAPAGAPTRPVLLACPTTLDGIGRIIAPVMIDGSGPYRFLVDTGANYSMMSPALAQRLGLTPRAGALLEVTGITGAQRLPWVPVARLRVGRFRLANVRMPITASPVMNGLDGILGLAGFPAERIAVDFRHNIVWIGHSNGGDVWGYLAIPAELTPGGLLSVHARVGSIPVVAIIDTGSPRTLGNEALHRALLRNAARPKDNAQIFGVTRQVSNGDVAGAPTVYLGPAAIGRLDIVFGDIPIFKVWHLDDRPAVVIGMDVLGTVDGLILDYRRARVYILPNRGQGVQVMQTYSPLGSPLPGGP